MRTKEGNERKMTALLYTNGKLKLLPGFKVFVSYILPSFYLKEGSLQPTNVEYCGFYELRYMGEIIQQRDSR